MTHENNDFLDDALTSRGRVARVWWAVEEIIIMLCKECYYYIYRKSYVVSEQIVRVASRLGNVLACTWNERRQSWQLAQAGPGRDGSRIPVVFV